MAARVPGLMRIVMPGGSGQVGTILSRHFHALGHQVVVLSRTMHPAPWRVVQWDAANLGAWTSEVDGSDAVIHLSGRSVNCRYTQEHRREIVASRVLTTRLVGQAIADAKRPPAVWLNAGTSTIYRHALDRPMDEFTGEMGGDEPGVPETWSFSVGVAREWEEALYAAATPQTTRRICLRTSMVMSPDREGVFDVLLGLVSRGLGGAQGKGTQYVSWMHDQDYARATQFLLEHEDIRGPVNMTSAHPLPNRQFMAEIRRASGNRFGIPAAEWMLEIGAIFLQTETELILKSRCVIPGVLERAGFEFLFPSWPQAADNLVRRWRAAASQPAA